MHTVLMERALSAATLGTILTGHYRRTGVHTSLGTTVVEIRGDQRAEAVCLASGAVLGCDVIVVGVGSRGHISAHRQQYRAVGGRDRCRCALPIRMSYAAGDAAATYSPLLGRYGRMEHESNAKQEGTVAARKMLGGTTVDKSLPFVRSKQFGLDMWCVSDTRAI
ncbi:hypothetical protein K875_05677 [Mycobacterium [tuberculosis] TKK-01-0051]|uniref:FAD/NAD(P)-binding domain-containing protein n=2 Tax=Mycobacterium colombiense TaxID=339268 RepID=A0A051TJT5_9MYCO|nr:hypothetical protein K875_05677 [Mycobacterium [tuberculosis] TKK-01-0051]